MQLIKLGPASGATQDTQLGTGEAIIGYTTAVWTERYREASEFKIEAPLSSGLMDFLPLGSFVSHIDTGEIMIVENHEIDQPKGKDPTIEITGRSFETFLEHRTIGDWYVAWANDVPAEFIKASATTASQAFDIIRDHLTHLAGVAGDANDEIAGFEAVSTLYGSPTLTSEARDLEYKDVYSYLIDLLKIDDLGIRTSRQMGGDSYSSIIVHNGVPRTDKVKFSWMRGDLENVKYFFSNRKYKNRARVMSRYAQTLISPAGPVPQYYDRRTILVDARDLDEQLSAAPIGGALTALVAKLNTRGRQALAKQKNLVITQADVSNNTTYRYRRDYYVGDLVTVEGDFDTAQTMRVTEYTEVDDGKGTSGHPTLEAPGV